MLILLYLVRICYCLIISKSIKSSFRFTWSPIFWETLLMKELFNGNKAANWKAQFQVSNKIRPSEPNSSNQTGNLNHIDFPGMKSSLTQSSDLLDSRFTLIPFWFESESTNDSQMSESQFTYLWFLIRFAFDSSRIRIHQRIMIHQ